MASPEAPYVPRLDLQAGSPGHDIATAAQGFGQALQQFQASRAYNQASDTLQQIQQSEASESDKAKQRNDLANQLGFHLLGLGQTTKQVEMAQQMAAPKQTGYDNEFDLFQRGTPQQINQYNQYKQQASLGQHQYSESEILAGAQGDGPRNSLIEAKKASNPKFGTDGPTPSDIKYANKRLTEFSTAIDPNMRRGSNFAAQQGLANASDRLSVFEKQFPDGNVPKAQTAEAATLAATIMQGGNYAPHSDQLNAMIPHTGAGVYADTMSFLTGEQWGKNQQTFMKTMFDTGKREGDLAKAKVSQEQFAGVANYEDLRTSDALPKGKFEAVFKSRTGGKSMNDYDAYKANGYQLPNAALPPTPQVPANMPKPDFSKMSDGELQQYLGAPK
jgi:hypothetical protein